MFPTNLTLIPISLINKLMINSFNSEENTGLITPEDKSRLENSNQAPREEISIKDLEPKLLISYINSLLTSDFQ